MHNGIINHTQNRIYYKTKLRTTKHFIVLLVLFYFTKSRKGGARMEKVQHTESTIEVFENDIDLYLHQFQEEQEIEDLRTVPQSVWNGALRYIYNHVFKHNNHLLKSHNNVSNNNNIMDSNYNMYNYDLLLDIADYYIYSMCMVYNKEVSIIGYETLTGVSQENIYNWANENNKLSSKGFKIYKKLTQMREESLSNKLVDGKQNPVGTIAVLNRQFGWASPYVSDSNRQKQSLTAQELPKLGQNNNAYVNQIEEKAQS